MKVYLADSDNKIIASLGDLVAMLSIVVMMVFMIMAGSAFGESHCIKNHCAGYEMQMSGED